MRADMVALLYQLRSHTSPHSLTMVSSLWPRLEQEAALLAGHELFRLAEEVAQVNWEKYGHLILLNTTTNNLHLTCVCLATKVYCSVCRGW